MNRRQRLKHEMFGRVRNFGIANRDVFPEESAVGKKFGQLATVIASIEEQLVRRAQARAEARKVKGTTRQAAMRAIKALASTGRRAATDETAPHPFRLPRGRAATLVLSTARLFREEAERRKEEFLELGMPPAFLENFDRVVNDLADAVALQQDSRGTRGRADGAIEVGLDQGAGIIADLDVAVPNALGTDESRLAQWTNARRIDHPSSGRSKPATAVVDTPNTPAPVEATRKEEAPVATPEPELDIAS